MANGWALDGAGQEQIEDSIKDALDAARSCMPTGESLKDCKSCGEEIPEKRRAALRGVRTCVACQSDRDRAFVAFSSTNRRGSKDSQLR